MLRRHYFVLTDIIIMYVEINVRENRGNKKKDNPEKLETYWIHKTKTKQTTTTTKTNHNMC